MAPHDHHHGDDDQIHDHDRGLAFDLGTLMARRRALKLFAGVGLATVGIGSLAACGGSDGSTSSAGATSATTTAAAAGTTTATAVVGESTAATTAASATPIPEETAGPYPGDGSNGVNVLTESGIVRSDITSSFGSASGVATGVPLAIELTVTDTANGGAALAGAAVYLWHCDIDGQYSMYDLPDQNYLRGVQEADVNGKVAFTSIFPACYAGRWPHIHFQVYPDVAEAIAAGEEVATSQIALPQDACEAVYASDGYGESIAKLGQVSLETDNVFSDGWDAELGTVTGSVADGYTVTLPVPV